MESWRAPNELVSLRRVKRPRVSDASENPETPQSSTSTAQAVDLQAQTYRIDLGIGSLSTADTDWSLESKLRIVSSEEFMWLNASKPQHEAKAHSGMQWSKEAIDTLDEVLVLFHQSRIVWMHPFFPFLDVFPRVEAKALQTTAVNDREASLLRDHWSTSFHSAFELLQYGHCSYFYVCANTMTILFLSGKVVQNGQDLALITPTTSGFRAAMKKQGVKFSMPLVTKATSPDSHEIDWLRSMTDSKIPLHHAETLNAQPTSLVSVEGGDMNALMNFVLNNKNFMSKEGRFAGIPPTLLAPTQFLGATMHALKVKTSKVKEMINKDRELVDKYYMDISGPIMPHNVRLLKSILDGIGKQYSIQHHENNTSSFNWYFQSKQ